MLTGVPDREDSAALLRFQLLLVPDGDGESGRGGHLTRVRLICCRQQLHPKARFANAATRIDARPEQKAEMIDIGRFIHPRHVRQYRKPDIFSLRHDLQALRHKRAVKACQRHHVAHGAERDTIEQRKEIW